MHCQTADGRSVPTAADRAILFQTIVGAWPPALKVEDRPGVAGFAKRIAAWQEKALREAKLHSDWSTPNEGYERAAADLVAWLLSEPSEMLAEIVAFARRIAPAGAANGLAQLLIKLTAPGVPDIYQGTELWDFSLVDPDNRAPVDFAVRRNALNNTDLSNGWADGFVKQRILACALAARKTAPQIFTDADYLPLQTAGRLATHVIAFGRVVEGSAAIVVCSRFIARLLDSNINWPFPQNSGKILE